MNITEDKDAPFEAGWQQGMVMARLLIATTLGGLFSFMLLVQHLYYAFVASPTTSFPTDRWIAVGALAATMMALNCTVVVACRRQGLLPSGK